MLHNVFAMELCLRLLPKDPLRYDLHDLIRHAPVATTPGKKWGMLKHATELLLSAEDRFEKGCWDFFNEDAKARSDYDMWCNGMITEEGARKGPSGDPGDGEQRYMTFTISLLLQDGTHSSRQLFQHCDIRQHHLWKRHTFVKILKGLTCVSFAAVKSDVYYLIPGDDRWGLTRQDLTDPKFHYLRTVED